MPSESRTAIMHFFCLPAPILSTVLLALRALQVMEHAQQEMADLKSRIEELETKLKENEEDSAAALKEVSTCGRFLFIFLFLPFATRNNECALPPVTCATPQAADRADEMIRSHSEELQGVMNELLDTREVKSARLPAACRAAKQNSCDSIPRKKIN